MYATTYSEIQTKASTSTDNTVTIDALALKVTINQAADQIDPANSGSVRFAVVFTKPVDNFTASAINISGTASGTKIIQITGSGLNYEVSISGITSSGTIIADIPAGGHS